MEHVLNFVDKELSIGALAGPFSQPPFAPWTRVSPLMTRPKKGTSERRVIVDLTYPEGKGVNDGISISDYYSQDISYTLPTLGDMVTRLQICGKGAQTLGLTQTLGLKLADHKCVPPATNIEWLGYEINTITMTVSIPTVKLQEIVAECELWATKTRANKRMIQSLAGCLLHLTSCIVPARRFIVRVLATLRSMSDRSWTTLSDDFRLYLTWFKNYARDANGIYYYKAPRDEVIIECDSSLLAGGGVAGDFCYTWKYSDKHTTRFNSIHHLEAINLLVVYKSLASHVAIPGVLIVINTDNMASSIALETGRTKDNILGNCARELWLQLPTITWSRSATNPDRTFLWRMLLVGGITNTRKPAM